MFSLFLSHIAIFLSDMGKLLDKILWSKWIPAYLRNVLTISCSQEIWRIVINLSFTFKKLVKHNFIGVWSCESQF